MKKFIYVLFILFLITGCSNQYNLEISNDGIKEKIVAKILTSDIPDYTQAGPNIEVDDPITPFIMEDQYPFSDNNKIKYNKSVDKDGSLTIVNLDYDYSFEDYKKSRVYTECFSKKNFEYGKNGYLLQMSGRFYCLYGDEIEINIKTKNKVNSHNADKVTGNTYTWIINKDNASNANIKINISKQSADAIPVTMIVVGVIILVIIIFGYIVLKNISNRDEINKI